MWRWIYTVILCAGCSVSTVVDSTPKLVPAMSQAQPLVVATPTAPVRIVSQADAVWNESDTNVVSFNLYYSSTSSHVYDQAIRGIPTLGCVVSNLTPGTTYYLAVTAVDTNGVESDLSDQYVFVMPTNLEFGLVFDRSVTNVSVQSSTDLITWSASSAQPRTNGLWRVEVDPDSPVEFYRGIGQVIPTL